MSYTVIVEQKVGKLPDVSWRVVFEREVFVSGYFDFQSLIGNLHTLYSALPDHRVIIRSDYVLES